MTTHMKSNYQIAISVVRSDMFLFFKSFLKNLRKKGSHISSFSKMTQ